MAKVIGFRLLNEADEALLARIDSIAARRTYGSRSNIIRLCVEGYLAKIESGRVALDDGQKEARRKMALFKARLAQAVAKKSAHPKPPRK